MTKRNSNAKWREGGLRREFYGSNTDVGIPRTASHASCPLGNCEGNPIGAVVPRVNARASRDVMSSSRGERAEEKIELKNKLDCALLSLLDI